MDTETRSSRKVTVSCPFCLKLNRIDLGRAKDRPKCGECGKPILLDRPVKVNDGDFERVVGNSDAPILVDFYADWCGPCKIMAPLLDQVAQERIGQVLVAKLDTDRNPATARRLAISGIPTLILFQNGNEVAREVGAVPRARLEALLHKVGSAPSI